MTYTVGTLFSGIGVPDLCAELLGMQSVWAVEKEPYCQKVLRRHFPSLDIHDDIFDVRDLPQVDFVIAGFPCQPFSSAGARKGDKDPRYLVPEMLRVLREVKPRVILLENVPGFANLDDGNTFKRLLRALAEMGFDAEWCHLRASDFGAPHIRERWFLVAYTAGNGNENSGAGQASSHQNRNGAPPQSRRQHKQHGIISSSSMGNPTRKRTHAIQQSGQVCRAQSSSMADTRSKSSRSWRSKRALQKRNTAFDQSGQGHSQSRVGRVAYGTSSRVDRYHFKPFPAYCGEPQHAWEPPRIVTKREKDTTNRQKAIGNSMVVPVVYAVMQSVLAWLQEQDKAIAA